MPENIQRLPIKVVGIAKNDYQKSKTTGGSPKIIGDIQNIPKKREEISTQVNQIEKYFLHAFIRKPPEIGSQPSPPLPVVARVILKEKALAKSHRPTSLFSKNTCPIIGDQGFGKLLVSIAPDGLKRFRSRLCEDLNNVKANISTIERIEPYTAHDAAEPIGLKTLQNIVRDGQQTLKLRLFQHIEPKHNDLLLKTFREHISAQKLPTPEEVQYTSKYRVFKIRNVTPSAVEPLAGFVGTQSIGCFSEFHCIPMTSIPVAPADPNIFSKPEHGHNYATVGIVDTGINPDDPILRPWITKRHPFMHRTNQNNNHGSFMAGLVVYGRQLNHGNPLFPGVASKIIDVVAIPGKDGIPDGFLLGILKKVIPKHPEVKIWNLSLGSKYACNDGNFSDFALALDELQDKHDVIFVLAAGNIAAPFRGWPPENIGERDRICTPADSARAITVGSVAHLDSSNSCVKKNEPSPFSRRGPGSACLPKPEISHCGGNCDNQGNYHQIGVLSFDDKQNVAENAGTSCAAPLITTLLANIHAKLAHPISQNLAKALLVHSALLNSNNITSRDIRYRGFGIPMDCTDILNCTSSMITLIFEPDLWPNFEFEKRNFPVPLCMRDNKGKTNGEFSLTLVYDPPLDPNYSSEYCRTNVDVSLGTYDPILKGKRKGKLRQIIQIPHQPKDIKRSRLYEKYLVQHGFKWSPVKVYRRLIKYGIQGQEWRLCMSTHCRSGFWATKPQKAALLVTMRDPSKKQPVYDETIALINKIGWSITNLRLREEVRLKL